MIMGQGDNPRNFVSNVDVAKFAAIALTNPQAHNQTIEIGGLDNLTSKQVAAVYARVAGVKLQQRTMPRSMIRVQHTPTKPMSESNPRPNPISELNLSITIGHGS
jgi:nucleoside-diphosphate-sugar epimerase